jgi:hypothetical protein
MVKQIESAAGPAAHAERFLPSGCPIEVFVNIEYRLQERSVAAAVREPLRQVASVGGLAIILGWHCGGSRSLQSHAFSPG